jgi:hypothetical protein
MKTSPPHRNGALTLIEVVIMISSVVFLAALLIPPLWYSRSGPDPRLLNCISNLKQIGVGWLCWAHDYETSDLPFRVPTMGSSDPLRSTAWWQYSIISNYIISPKLFVCPEDKNVGDARRQATSWSISARKGGFTALGFRDLALSYTINLDTPRLSFDGQASDVIVGTDRSIRFDGRKAACSAGVGEAEVVRVKGKNGQNSPATAAWTNAIHRSRGNVLSLDGAVQQTSSKDLDALCDLSDDNGSIHFLVPK